MPRYIDADEIYYHKNCGGCESCNCDGCDDYVARKSDIDAIDTADVQEVVHAHWYKDKITKLYKCSNCRKYATYGFANARVWEQCLSKYCPFCSATMDEKEN